MLILYYDSGDWPIFRYCFNESDVTCRALLKYRYLSLFLTLLPRFLGFGWSLSARLAYYCPQSTDNKLIVVFDTKISKAYLCNLKNKNPNAKIVVWCWNPINPATKLLEDAKGFDIWTYSPYDSEKYDLYYSPQFYFDSIVKQFSYAQTDTEPQGEKAFFFTGREKGRETQINAIAKEIRNASWECHIDYLQQRSKGDFMGCRTITTYDEIVRKTLRYQGILDISAGGPSGLSLRVMESAFFHKKLITTNPVVMQYDFYNESNIYVWGKSNMALEEFLDLPYRPVPREIMDKYLVSNWATQLQAAYGIESGNKDTMQVKPSETSCGTADESIIRDVC